MERQGLAAYVKHLRWENDNLRVVRVVNVHNGVLKLRAEEAMDWCEGLCPKSGCT